jgi:hypothetical protein
VFFSRSRRQAKKTPPEKFCTPGPYFESDSDPVALVRLAVSKR